MKIKVFVICILMFVSCKNKDLCLLQSEINKKLEIYIEKHPINQNINKSTFNYKNGFSTPSYHMYLNINNNDTILTIRKANYYDPSLIDIEDSIKDLNYSGLIYYHRYPVFLYGFEKSCVYQKVKTISIPDSLREPKNITHIGHIKSERKDFKIKIKK